VTIASVPTPKIMQLFLPSNSAVCIQTLSSLLGVEEIKNQGILRYRNSIIVSRVSPIPFTLNIPLHLAHFLLCY
jgi:hypothetical protein